MMIRWLVALGLAFSIPFVASPADAQPRLAARLNGPSFAFAADEQGLSLQLDGAELGAVGEVTVSHGTHPDWGLVVAGSITLGVGYVVSATFGALASNPLLFIPVAGGAIHGPVNGSAGGWALGLSLFAVQTTGLVLLIVGLVADIPNEPPVAASWTPSLAAGPGDAGLSLTWAL